jgi:hypothetical protein
MWRFGSDRRIDMFPRRFGPLQIAWYHTHRSDRFQVIPPTLGLESRPDALNAIWSAIPHAPVNPKRGWLNLQRLDRFTNLSLTSGPNQIR